MQNKNDFMKQSLEKIINDQVEIKVQEYIKTIWLNDLIDRVIKLEEFKTLSNFHMKDLNKLLKEKD